MNRIVEVKGKLKYISRAKATKRDFLVVIVL